MGVRVPTWRLMSVMSYAQKISRPFRRRPYYSTVQHRDVFERHAQRRGKPYCCKKQHLSNLILAGLRSRDSLTRRDGLN